MNGKSFSAFVSENLNEKLTEEQKNKAKELILNPINLISSAFLIFIVFEAFKTSIENTNIFLDKIGGSSSYILGWLRIHERSSNWIKKLGINRKVDLSDLQW
jgi:hypothetical protein